MKILEIIPQLNQGGAERFVVDLCNELVKNNQVTLVVLYSIDKTGFFVQDLSPKVNLISMDKHPGVDLGLVFKLYKFICQNKPDIVHTHLRSIMYCALAYVCCNDIHFFHTVHNDAAVESGNIIGKWIRRFVFRCGLVVPITISDESQNSFSSFYGLNSKLIYNGRPQYGESLQASDVKQELEGLQVEKNSTTIVNIARFNPQKNQLLLAKAVKSINDKERAVELFLIGREDDSIVSQIKELNCKYIHLLGTRKNPRDYMKAADAFCLSSLFEGMPITLIECFSVGAIPICTPVGGIKDMIVDGINGILAKGCSQTDIEEAILMFLNMTEKAKNAMREASLESYEKYSMERCAMNYLELFKS